MWLAIDVGNSNAVFGVFEAGTLEPCRVHRLETHPVGTSAELRVRIQAALPDTRLEGAPTDILIASVVPPFTTVVREALTALYPRAEIRVIDSNWPFSFHIGTEAPERTGIDRLVNAEAAVRLGWADVGPVIVVDAGTATTVCAVSRETFLGGAILPGPGTMRDSLAARGAQLHSVALETPPHAIGRSTDQALQSGLVLGYASMIDGMIERYSRELKLPRPRVLATGGYGSWLKQNCTRIDAVDPNLTLKGIAYLYESIRRR